MAWDDFGQSWIGVIANPAGYVLGRKSPSNAAGDYHGSHPIENVLTGNESELSYNEARAEWTDACASQLKSDDVGKTKSNSLKACESAWDNDPLALQVIQRIRAGEDYKISQTETGNKIRTTVVFIVVIALVVILVFFLIKKYRTS
jgi:hypothetical protein